MFNGSRNSNDNSSLMAQTKNEEESTYIAKDNWRVVFLFFGFCLVLFCFVLFLLF